MSTVPEVVEDCHQLIAWVILVLDQLSRSRGFQCLVPSLLMLLLLLSSSSAQANSRTFALVMGANTGNLTQARQDAQKFSRAISPLIRSASHQQVYLQATVAQFRQGMQWLMQVAGPQDTVIIYFSGHGSTIEDMDGDEREGPDGVDEVFVMDDANRAAHIGGAHIVTDDQFHRWVQQLRTDRVIFFLDACHSGGLAKGGGAMTKPNYRQKFFIAGILGRRPSSSQESAYGAADFNRGVLVSAASETGLAYENRRGGVMTRHLVGEMMAGRNRAKSLYQIVKAASNKAYNEIWVRPGIVGNYRLLQGICLGQ